MEGVNYCINQEDTDYRFMRDMLPWFEQLPEICRSKTKTTKNTLVFMICRVLIKKEAIIPVEIKL